MGIFLSELIGTCMLILLGNGVVANVVLKGTKGHNGGWIVITFGWAIAVFVGIFTSAEGSGGHLNPAVTVAFAWLGKISGDAVLQYLGGQLLGAMAGSLLVFLAYRRHYYATDDHDAKLASFATSPAIDKPLDNMITEAIGTFVLVFAVLFIASPASTLGALDALPVALLVLGIGLSLGGPTGYAINPVRDLGPRIMHAILPIGSKGSSNWKYAWVPVTGPIVGGLVAAVLFNLIKG